VRQEDILTQDLCQALKEAITALKRYDDDPEFVTVNLTFTSGNGYNGITSHTATITFYATDELIDWLSEKGTINALVEDPNGAVISIQEVQWPKKNLL